ncbi:MAG: 6-hydroxymethylpterin diphosphokinase MptE-like protein [bacterium]
MKKRSDALEKTYAASDTRSQRAGWLANIRANRQIIFNNKDAAILKGILKNIPGIVIGAGPSLAKNLHQLRPVQKRYALFCCDRAFKSVVACEITPQFVVVCDAQDIVADFFTGMPTGEMILLCPTFVSPKVLALKWKEIVFFNMLDADTSFSEAAMNLTDHKVGMIPGTVIAGNTAFVLAKLTGCNPVTFIGCDMSMKDMTDASPRDILFESTGIDGGTVYSVPGYLAGFDWLLRYLRVDQDFRAGRLKVYNCTEGGIMYSDDIQGMPLIEFIEKYPGTGGSIRTRIVQGLI